MRLHDEKPSVEDRPSSYAIDLIIWNPRVREDKPLTDLLRRYELGERSQTVVWLNKFTVRLTMWRHQYLTKLADAQWDEAARAVMDFLTEVNAHYRPRAIEYDTRAFTVGLHKAARRRRVPVSRVPEGRPGSDTPVWWILTF
jgi:hypothetical protein